ncbi:hypothetical protein NUSPORA_00346 [Nucleospora cyclopteri]
MWISFLYGILLIGVNHCVEFYRNFYFDPLTYNLKVLNLNEPLYNFKKTFWYTFYHADLTGPETDDVFKENINIFIWCSKFNFMVNPKAEIRRLFMTKKEILQYFTNNEDKSKHIFNFYLQMVCSKLHLVNNSYSIKEFVSEMNKIIDVSSKENLKIAMTETFKKDLSVHLIDDSDKTVSLKDIYKLLIKYNYSMTLNLRQLSSTFIDKDYDLNALLVLKTFSLYYVLGVAKQDRQNINKWDLTSNNYFRMVKSSEFLDYIFLKSPYEWKAENIIYIMRYFIFTQETKLYNSDEPQYQKDIKDIFDYWCIHLHQFEEEEEEAEAEAEEEAEEEAKEEEEEEEIVSVLPKKRRRRKKIPKKEPKIKPLRKPKPPTYAGLTKKQRSVLIKCFSVTIGCFLIVILLFIFYYFYRKKQKKNLSNDNI